MKYFFFFSIFERDNSSFERKDFDREESGWIFSGKILRDCEKRLAKGSCRLETETVSGSACGGELLEGEKDFCTCWAGQVIGLHRGNLF